MILREHFQSPIELDEKQGKDKDVIGRTTFAFLKADEPNLNKRIYPEKIVKAEIDRLRGRLAEDKCLFGAPSHPEDGAHEIKIGDISHRISDLWYDDKSHQAMATVEILNTKNGRDLAVILRRGRIFASARGSGTTKQLGEMEEVNSDWKLHGIDMSLSPSFSFAAVQGLEEQNLFESAEFPVDEKEPDLEAEINETEDEMELEKEFASLRLAFEDLVRAEMDPNAWVKDFSQDEVIVQTTKKVPVAGEITDVLLKIPYSIDPNTDEITLDFNEIKPLKQTIVYESEQYETKFGLLSEMEMRITGAKQFGKTKPLTLSIEEQRYLSPAEAKLLREEKFKK